MANIGAGNDNVGMNINAKIPAKTVDIFAPDIFPGSEGVEPPTFMVAPVEWYPDNFFELPKEEQEKIKTRLKTMGIRMRSDIKGKTIPTSRRTLDI